MLHSERFSEPAVDAAGGRLERLRQQERVWFAWVCRLHDVHSGAETPHSAAVLSIAQRRWAEARRALQRETQCPETRRLETQCLGLPGRPAG